MWPCGERFPIRFCGSDGANSVARYETAVAAIVAARSEGEVRVIDREGVRKTRREPFGFALPNLGIFGGNSSEENPAQTEIDGASDHDQYVGPAKDIYILTIRTRGMAVLQGALTLAAAQAGTIARDPQRRVQQLIPADRRVEGCQRAAFAIECRGLP